jgi:hypothetical protein
MPPHSATTPAALTYAILIVTLALGGPAAGGCDGQQRPRFEIFGSLTLKNGELRLFGGGEANPPVRVKSPVPYRIVSMGDYAVVTTCGADLVPVTWTTDGDAVNRFDDTLPLIVQPPVAVLGGLPRDISGAGAGITLLGTGGRAAWHGDSADILWPVVGDSSGLAFCIIPSADADPIAAYGSDPQIVCVECPSGRERWRSSFPHTTPVYDATLYGVGSQKILVSVQLGYEDFGFYVFDLQTGKPTPYFEFTGALAVRSTYPGPQILPVGVTRKDDAISVTIYEQKQGWQRVTFDLGRSTGVSYTSVTPPGTLDESNPHPVESHGAAVPPIFPQHVLPEPYGDAWTIPALMNAKNEILVVGSDGALWVEPD